MEERAIVVFSTAPDAEVAGELAKTLVGNRLAACVNIVDGLRSIYWWRERFRMIPRFC